MAPDKSLAAEIEARAVKAQTGLTRAYELIADQYGTWSPENGTQFRNRFLAEAVGIIETARKDLAEIAALQSRAFEDGARWMRERAEGVARAWMMPKLSAAEQDFVSERYVAERRARNETVIGIADRIAALPLQPEGERNA